jgi:hypothetical protein
MKTHTAVTSATTALLVSALASPGTAQQLHVNDRWKECSIVLDPNLTPEAWRQFARELGLVIHFRPMVSATPLGRGSFEVAVVNWGTRIDDADPAWNDASSHPDEHHRLFDGSTLFIPGVMGRVGVTDQIDAGVYFTKAIGANYGFVGGQVPYNLWSDPERRTAAAARRSPVSNPRPSTVRSIANVLVAATVGGIAAMGPRNLFYPG